MKVSVTFDVDFAMRFAINHRFGRRGLATRSQIKDNIEAIVEGVWADYLAEHDAWMGDHPPEIHPLRGGEE